MNQILIRLEPEMGAKVAAIMKEKRWKGQAFGMAMLECYLSLMDTSENKKPPKAPAVSPAPSTSQDFKLALEHLKAVTGRNFKVSTDLTSRLKEYDLDDIKQVIKYKAKEWMGGSMQKYLRPETLFNKTKFEGYLNDSQQLVSTEPQHENRPQQNLISNNELGWSNASPNQPG